MLPVDSHRRGARVGCIPAPPGGCRPSSPCNPRSSGSAGSPRSSPRERAPPCCQRSPWPPPAESDASAAPLASVHCATFLYCVPVIFRTVLSLVFFFDRLPHPLQQRFLPDVVSFAVISPYRMTPLCHRSISSGVRADGQYGAHIFVTYIANNCSYFHYFCNIHCQINGKMEYNGNVKIFHMKGV